MASNKIVAISFFAVAFADLFIATPLIIRKQPPANRPIVLFAFGMMSAIMAGFGVAAWMGKIFV